MIRLAVWCVVGLLLGLVVHLATLLALPRLATQAAVDRLQSLGPAGQVELLPPPSPADTVLPSPDPFMRLAVCRYDLADGPVRVRAPVTTAFFAMSFYTPDGLNYYALTDKAASEGTIELTIYSALQLAEVRSREGPDTPEALRVESPADRGIVVFRALVPEASFAAMAEDALRRANCGRADDAAVGKPAP
jgi:uncharacterized membrane protein